MKNIKTNTSRGQDPSLNSWQLLGLVGELGYIIALPLIILMLIGRWLDETLGTKVLFTILGLLLALVSSTYIIYRKIKRLNND